MVLDCLKYATIHSLRNNVNCATLIDSCSSNSYILSDVANGPNLDVLNKVNSKVILANSATENDFLGVCYTDIKIKGRTYENIELGVFKNLCAEVLLGGDFLCKHNRFVLC